MIEQMGHEFQGDQYHLLHKNCNHFTAAFCKVRFLDFNISISYLFLLTNNKLLFIITNLLLSLLLVVNW